MSIQSNSRESGLTLVEVLVGSALMLIVFMGIFGLVILSMRVVGESKARVTALSLANEKIELARNLAYSDVGTEHGIPSGTIPESETLTRNGIEYTVKISAIYIDDPFDGLAPADTLPVDYKRVKVVVDWNGFLGGEIFMQTDVAPKGFESIGSGGILSILVFDASGQPVPQADIHIENSHVSPVIDAHYQSGNNGKLILPGAPVCDGCYKITVTKAGYSEDRNYESGELVRGVALATPDNPLISVRLNQIMDVSFNIDRLAEVNASTIRYREEKTWEDTFVDESKISQKNQTVASTTLAAMELEQNAGQYFSSGYFISDAITPSSLVHWGRLLANDQRPAGTSVKYQLLYATNSSWELIPDSDLTIGGIKNSDGFDSSPLDLSGLSSVDYQSLKIKANLSTNDSAYTPEVYDWTLTWYSSDTASIIGNVNFSMHGAKRLGLNGSGQPIYKYEANLSTDANGHASIPSLEWDNYRITINGGSIDYDIANSSPPQPFNLNPSASQLVILKLDPHSINTLLVTVKSPAGVPLAGASVRLHRSGYDQQILSSESGQAFFDALGSGSYELEVKLGGYQDWVSATPFLVSGQSEQVLNLTVL